MTVYVVVCCDPADRGSELWTHGVYETEAQARRVFDRLTRDSYLTVRLDAKPVQPRRQTRRKER